MDSIHLRNPVEPSHSTDAYCAQPQLAFVTSHKGTQGVVGVAVGVAVGVLVGVSVGAAVGFAVGFAVGVLVGVSVGAAVGAGVSTGGAWHV